jgi:hypothetical protein
MTRKRQRPGSDEDQDPQEAPVPPVEGPLRELEPAAGSRKARGHEENGVDLTEAEDSEEDVGVLLHPKTEKVDPPVGAAPEGQVHVDARSPANLLALANESLVEAQRELATERSVRVRHQRLANETLARTLQRKGEIETANTLLQGRLAAERGVVNVLLLRLMPPDGGGANNVGMQVVANALLRGLMPHDGGQDNEEMRRKLAETKAKLEASEEEVRRAKEDHSKLSATARSLSSDNERLAEENRKCKAGMDAAEARLEGYEDELQATARNLDGVEWLLHFAEGRLEDIMHALSDDRRRT